MDSELGNIINKARKGESLIPDLNEIIGSGKYRLFLDRFNHYNKEDLSEEIIENILRGIGDSIDGSIKKDDMGLHYSMVNKIFNSFLPFIKNGREIYLSSLFKECQSIGWLLQWLISNRKKSGESSNAILEEKEVNKGIQIILNRIKGKERKKIINVPYLISFLFKWKEALKDNNEEIKSWVSEITEEDIGFLKFLAKCQTRVHSSQGSYFKLNIGAIREFIDIENVRPKLEDIYKFSNDEELKKMSQDIIGSIERAENEQAPP